jgi:hypothetical protein
MAKTTPRNYSIDFAWTRDLSDEALAERLDYAESAGLNNLAKALRRERNRRQMQAA